MGTRRTLPWLLLALLALAGCGTTYSYRGYLQAVAADEQPRVFLVYWQATERPLWFDEVDGTVRVLPEGGAVLDFVEGDDGIVLRRGPTLDGGRDGDIRIGGVCGRILTADTVAGLGPGELLLSIWCDGVVDEFSVTPYAGLKPRDAPYRFLIRRVEVTGAEGTPGFPVPVGTPVEVDAGEAAPATALLPAA